MARRAQLRTTDGINFTRAGRLKLAFYVEREMRRKTGTRRSAPWTSSPRPATRARSRSDRTARSGWSARSSRCRTRLPGASDTLAGAPEPMVYDPTTGAMKAVSPAAERTDAKRAGTRRVVRYRVIVKGESVPSIAGRVDDFAWPPGRREPAAPPVADGGR